MASRRHPNKLQLVLWTFREDFVDMPSTTPMPWFLTEFLCLSCCEEAPLTGKTARGEIKPSTAWALPLLHWAVCGLSSLSSPEICSHHARTVLGREVALWRKLLASGEAALVARRQESPDLARGGLCQRGIVWASPAQKAPAQAGACSCHRLEQCSLEEKEEREPSSCQSVGKGEATFLSGTGEVCSRLWYARWGCRAWGPWSAVRWSPSRDRAFLYFL